MEPLSLRTRKDRIEQALFERRRNLFTHLSWFYFDTASIHFEGQDGESLGRHVLGKDHRPDLNQMIVGAVLDHSGPPLCSQMWLGNTTDVTTLVPEVEWLRAHFRVGEVCIVADRGMISARIIEQIEACGWRRIPGVRMRSTGDAKQQVLGRAGHYEEV